MSDVDLRYWPVFRIAWDGEISMSGEPHVQSIGREFLSYGEALDAMALLRKKPGLRVETRQVSEWERI